MRLPINIILLADAYKHTHWLQMPPNTQYICAYGESRGTEFPQIEYTRRFGLQGFIMDYLEGVVVEQWMIDEASEILGEVFDTHEYFNRKGWETVLNRYGGKLPVQIFAVKEGTRIPHGNVSVFVKSENDPAVAWVAPWLETALLRATWYPSAVCTISSYVNDIQTEWRTICGAPHNPFFLHDFGARGVSSHESAELGGAAHLVNFLGTDTVECLPWLKSRYGQSSAGYSVFATEHGSTTIYGRAGEIDAYRNSLTKCHTDKICSLVIDSYSTKNAVLELLGTQLKPLILARNAPTVFRPDSGDPIQMSLNVVSWLGEKFGYELNADGFKVLHPKVRVLYGDGINILSIDDICANLVAHGWSIENIIFGMGGKLLQGINRDTFKEAFKTCFAIVDGIPVEIYKDPDTDSGKSSKRGLLKLVKDANGKYHTCRVDEYPDLEDQLELVFSFGSLTRYMTLEEVRAQS